MNKKDICELCTEYSTDEKCESEDECVMIALWKENSGLKEKIKNLEKELQEAKIEMSYMVNPCAIGNRNDMGW